LLIAETIFDQIRRQTEMLDASLPPDNARVREQLRDILRLIDEAKREHESVKQAAIRAMQTLDPIGAALANLRMSLSLDRRF
jgi:hypothetical protein